MDKIIGKSTTVQLDSTAKVLISCYIFYFVFVNDIFLSLVQLLKGLGLHYLDIHIMPIEMQLLGMQRFVINTRVDKVLHSVVCLV